MLGEKESPAIKKSSQSTYSRSTSVLVVSKVVSNYFEVMQLEVAYYEALSPAIRWHSSGKVFVVATQIHKKCKSTTETGTAILNFGMTPPLLLNIMLQKVTSDLQASYYYTSELLGDNMPC